MKVSGSATLHADRAAVWQALNDPAILVRTIPGCARLETIGPDAYKMTLRAGVASIKGLYEGRVRLSDQDEPGSFVLTADGTGAPGTVSANVRVTLDEVDGSTTELSYDADAIVGGMIGGVGQRMLSGVAKKTAAEFFGKVDDVLTGKAPAATTVQEPTPAGASATTQAAEVTPQVFESSTGTRGVSTPGFAEGVALGALAALAGALVGGFLAGRRRR
jgi:carbon monoxide dehydrogenase subunit G